MDYTVNFVSLRKLIVMYFGGHCSVQIIQGIGYNEVIESLFLVNNCLLVLQLWDTMSRVVKYPTDL